MLVFCLVSGRRRWRHGFAEYGFLVSKLLNNKPISLDIFLITVIRKSTKVISNDRFGFNELCQFRIERMKHEDFILG